jgi:hypothetical protein
MCSIAISTTEVLTICCRGCCLRARVLMFMIELFTASISTYLSLNPAMYGAPHARTVQSASCSKTPYSVRTSGKTVRRSGLLLLFAIVILRVV